MKFDLYTNSKNKIKERRPCFFFFFSLNVQRLLVIGKSQPSSPNLKISQHFYEGRVTSYTVGTVYKKKGGDFIFGLC